MSLKKGEKISYELIKEDQADDKEQIKFLPSDHKLIKISEEHCPTKAGCNFTVEALEDFELASIYFSANMSETEEKEEVVTYEIDKQVTRRVEEDD